MEYISHLNTDHPYHSLFYQISVTRRLAWVVFWMLGSKVQVMIFIILSSELAPAVHLEKDISKLVLTTCQ